MEKCKDETSFGVFQKIDSGIGKRTHMLSNVLAIKVEIAKEITKSQLQTPALVLNDYIEREYARTFV